MSAKKIGKAVFDFETELWIAERKGQKFHMNRRFIDSRPEVKRFQKDYSKALSMDTPSLKQPEKRKAYFAERDKLRKEWREHLLRISEELIQESHGSPILLRLDRDFGHAIDWRYCLYKGVIYSFDRPGLSDEKMVEQIEKLEGKISI